MRKTNNKGITLIALVITIIVMLILVVVVINLAINDNGVINNATTASKQTTIQAERETLLDLVLGKDVFDASNGIIYLTNLESKLNDDTQTWKDVALDNQDNPTILTVVGVKSGETFTVTNKGEIKVGKVEAPKTYYAWNDDLSLRIEEDRVYIKYGDVEEEQQGRLDNNGTIWVVEEEEEGEIPLATLSTNTISGEEVLLYKEGDSTTYLSTKKDVPSNFTPLNGNIYVRTSDSGPIERLTINEDGLYYVNQHTNELYKYIVIGDEVFFEDAYGVLSNNGDVLTFSWEKGSEDTATLAKQ